MARESRKLVGGGIAGSIVFALALAVLLAPTDTRWGDDVVVRGLALVAALAGACAWLALGSVRGRAVPVSAALVLAVLPWLVCNALAMFRSDIRRPPGAEQVLRGAVARLALLVDDRWSWTTGQTPEHLFDPHRGHTVLLLVIVAVLLTLSAFRRRSAVSWPGAALALGAAIPLAGLVIASAIDGGADAGARWLAAVTAIIVLPIAGALVGAERDRKVPALGAIAALVIALVIAGGNAEPARDFARAAELAHTEMLTMLGRLDDAPLPSSRASLFAVLAIAPIALFAVVTSEARRARMLGVTALASILVIVIAGDAFVHHVARERFDAILAVPAVAAIRRCGGMPPTTVRHVGGEIDGIDVVACVAQRRMTVGERYARLEVDESDAEALLRGAGAAHRSVTVLVRGDADAEAVLVVAAAALAAQASEVFIAWPEAWRLRGLRVRRPSAVGELHPRSRPDAHGPDATVTMIDGYPETLWEREIEIIVVGIELSTAGALLVATTWDWVVPIANRGAGIDLEVFRAHLRYRRESDPNQVGFFVAPRRGVSFATFLSVMDVALSQGFTDIAVAATGVRAARQSDGSEPLTFREQMAAQEARARAELERRSAEAIARGGTPRMQAGDPHVSGVLPPPIVRRALRQHTRDILECYEEELRERPYLEGSMTVELVVVPTGAIHRAVVHDSTVSDPPLEQCIVVRARGLQFPASDGITRVHVQVELWRGERRPPEPEPAP